METMMFEAEGGLLIAVSENGVCASDRIREFPHDPWDTPEGFGGLPHAWMYIRVYENELRDAKLLWRKEKPAEAGPVQPGGDQPS